ncbi:unnamed protein product [Spodoptera exigua]|nr:unnamed protein product [Spodoptera exigua]
MQRRRKRFDEPTMSDKTLLLNVEDLINTAFGTADRNVVNFKMIQAILHILARQMRLLEQEVVIQIDELGLEDDVSEDRDGRGRDRGGGHGRDRDKDRGGDRGVSHGRGRDKDRSGERVGRRGRERDDDQRGERKEERHRSRTKGGDRSGERGGDRSGERGGDRSGERGGDRSGDRESGRSRDRRGGRDEDTGGDRERGRAEDRGKGRSGETESESRGKGGGGGGGKSGGERVGGKGGGREGGRDEYMDRGGRAEDGGGRGGDRGSGRERGGGHSADREGHGGERGSAQSGKREYDKGGERGSSGRGEDRGGDRGVDKRGERGTQREDTEDSRSRQRSPRSGDRAGDRYDEHGQRDEYHDRTTGEGRRHPDRGGESEISSSYNVKGSEKQGRGGDRGGQVRQGHGGEAAMDSGARTAEGRAAEGERKKGKKAERIKGQRRGTLSESDTSLGRMPGSRTNINVTGSRVPRVGSIEVVTASQFALLERAVRELQKIAGPLPTPALPDNQRLREDLAKGTASLTDTMKAMQLHARVDAAEQGLTQMAGLLTQLAAMGALPSEMVARIGEMQHGQWAGQGPGQHAPFAGHSPEQAYGYHGQFPTHRGPTSPHGTQGEMAAGHTGGGAYPPDMRTQGHTGPPQSTATSMLSRGQGASAKPGAIDPATGLPRTARGSVDGGGWASDPTVAYRPVTHAEMENALLNIKEELQKAISTMTARATHSADVAANTSKNVAEKLDLALAIDKRISKLASQAIDYSSQLSGFDSGLATQMASFQEQMAQIKRELKEGLGRLEHVTANAESAALTDLMERYQILVVELEHTLQTHKGLTVLQNQLDGELRSLVECVEMLREQKADRDEVFDGLRDKADICRLNGLLHEEDFEHARTVLENELKLCYEKFKKQDHMWMTALKDLKAMAGSKAEIIQLMALKDSATEELRSIQAQLRELYIMLGEPKAAILMRMLAKNAACAACLTPALMEPTDPNYAKPFVMPAFRPPPLGEEEPCVAKPQPQMPADVRTHVCRRWAGGSHTLVADHVTRERAAPPDLHGPPTKRYTGYGTDGRLYMLEEELQPCLECNKLDSGDLQQTERVVAVEPKPSPNVGAGDQVVAGNEKEKEDKEEKEK